jgi:CheY-like chemotaxis protein
MANNTPDIDRLSFLIIEDEAVTRATTKKTLASLGATKVAVAVDGFEALAHLTGTTSPDVMLLDINMPEMSGAKLLRQLPDRNYPGAIIIVSGIDEVTISVAESVAKYHDLKVLGHIIKSLTQQALIDLLAKLE